MGWGVADFIARFASRRTGPFRTLLYMEVVGSAGLLVWIGLTGHAAAPIPRDTAFWIWVAVSGVINTLASLAFYRALETGLLTIVSPVCSAYPVVTVLVSVYLGEKLNAPHLAGIVFACVGVVLAATSFAAPAAAPAVAAGPLPQISGGDAAEVAKTHAARGVALTAAASLLYGVNFVVLGYHVTPHLDGVRSVLVLRAMSILTLLVIAAPARQTIAMKWNSVWLLITAVGIFDTLAFISSNLGLATGHVSVVTVLGSLFGAVTVFLGWIFLRERVEKSQWLGVFLIFVGIVLVSI